jgi:hypothetical protein
MPAKPVIAAVPDYTKLIKNVCHINWRVDLEALLSLGFLEEVLANASTPLADASTKTETKGN